MVCWACLSLANLFQPTSNIALLLDLRDLVSLSLYMSIMGDPDKLMDEESKYLLASINNINSTNHISTIAR